MIGRIFADMLELAVEGTAAVSRRLAFLGKSAPEEGVSPINQAVKIYLKSLRRLILFVLFFPVLILAIGIIGNLGWMVAFVGMFWALATIALSLVAAPLGLLVGGLLGGPKDIGERYVKLVLGVLLVELSFALFVAVFPVRNNLAALPIIIMAAAVLGILEARGANTIFTRRFIAGKASGILFIFTLSFFFPQTFGGLRGAAEKIDDWFTKALRGEKTEEIKKALPGSGNQSSSFEETYTFPEGVDQIEVPLHPTRWSGWVITPPGSRWRIDPPDSGWVDVRFLDGTRTRLLPRQPVWLGKHTRNGSFRLCGEGGSGIVTLVRR